MGLFHTADLPIYSLPFATLKIGSQKRPPNNSHHHGDSFSCPHEDILIAIKCYFDGSHGGAGWNSARFVTLAGFAADESLLSEFDDRWMAMLRNAARRPSTEYLHMRELRKRNGAFSSEKGWTDELRGFLVTDALLYLQTLDKKRCRLFACSVDTEALVRARAAGKRIAGIVRLCNHFCPQIVLAWYVQHYPGLVSSANYFFDLNEPFRHHFEQVWRKKRSERFDITGNREAWKIIKSVTSVELRETPAMQVADLFAWAVNRELCAQDGEFMKHLAHIARQVIPSSTIVLNDLNIDQAVLAQ